ncbi:hypothetical protein Tco_1453590, partial [Tanacetum coccineum]
DSLEKLDVVDTVQEASLKWDIEDPQQIKEAFINFSEDKFQANDSLITFLPISVTSGLTHDRHLLEYVVSLDQINAGYECGSDKAPDPDGFSFAFVKY